MAFFPRTKSSPPLKTLSEEFKNSKYTLWGWSWLLFAMRYFAGWILLCLRPHRFESSLIYGVWPLVADKILRVDYSYVKRIRENKHIKLEHDASRGISKQVMHSNSHNYKIFLPKLISQINWRGRNHDCKRKTATSSIINWVEGMLIVKKPAYPRIV